MPAHRVSTPLSTFTLPQVVLRSATGLRSPAWAQFKCHARPYFIMPARRSTRSGSTSASDLHHEPGVGRLPPCPPPWANRHRGVLNSSDAFHRTHHASGGQRPCGPPHQVPQPVPSAESIWLPSVAHTGRQHQAPTPSRIHATCRIAGASPPGCIRE